MVYREGAAGHAHFHPAARGEFAGMYLGPHAIAGSGLQDAPRLFGGEEPLVTEHVDKVGQPLFAHSGYHLAHQHVYIVGLPSCIGASHRVCTEEGAYNLHP